MGRGRRGGLLPSCPAVGTHHTSGTPASVYARVFWLFPCFGDSQECRSGHSVSGHVQDVASLGHPCLRLSPAEEGPACFPRGCTCFLAAGLVWYSGGWPCHVYRDTCHFSFFLLLYCYSPPSGVRWHLAWFGLAFSRRMSSLRSG